MLFKPWLLIETVSGLKELLAKGNQVISWGNVAGWDVYSAVVSHGPQQKIHTPAEFNTEQLVYDPAVDRIAQIKSALIEARQRLAYLGFRRMGGVVVFANPKKVGAYVGQDQNVGGYHSPQRHYILVDESFDDKKAMVEVIIHEHAHAFWKNAMTKEEKAMFVDWYKTNVVGGTENMLKNPNYDSMQALKEIIPKLDKAKIQKKITRHSSEFISRLLESLGWGYHGYETLHQLMSLRQSLKKGHPEGLVIANAVVRNWGFPLVKAILLNDVYLSGSSYRQETVKAGNEISIFRAGDRFILTKENQDFNVNEDDLLKYVKFDKGLLTPEQKQLLKDKLALAKKSWSTLLAPPAHKDKIEQALGEALGNTEFIINLDKLNTARVGLGKMFPVSHFFTTWKSLLGRRSKKIDDLDPKQGMEYLGNIYADAVMKKYHLIDPTKDEELMARVAGQSHKHLNGPAGGQLRDLLHKKGVLPSAYGGTNYQELWTTAVETAAYNIRAIHPELKKLLFQVAR